MNEKQRLYENYKNKALFKKLSKKEQHALKIMEKQIKDKSNERIYNKYR